MAAEKKCCVLGCEKIREQNNVLHKFPNPDNDADRFRTWAFAVGGNIVSLEDNYVYKYRRVCNEHFEHKYLTRSKMLARNAVPTLHLKALALKPGDREHNYCRPHVEIPNSVTHIAKTPIDKEKATLPDSVTNIAETRTEKEETALRQNNSHPYRYISEHEGADNELTGGTDVDPEMYYGAHDAEQPIEDGPFSWQKFKETVVPLDEKRCAADVTFVGESQLVPDLCDPEEIQIQAEFSCNVCSEPITGFRYACVQCSDWDLCGACEARGEHATHYVLRVPPHRTPKETQAVLAALRKMVEGLPIHEDPNVAVIKDEVKTEDPLCEDGALLGPRVEPAGDAARASAILDPLGALDPVSAASEDEIYETEYLETENEASMSLGEDFTTFVPKGPVYATRQKRKLSNAGHSYTVPQKAQKQDDQSFVCYDSNTGELVFAEKSKIPESKPAKDNSAPQRESVDSVAPQIEINNVILVDIDADTNACVASHAEISDLIAPRTETGSVTATSKLKQNKKFIAPQTENNVKLVQLDADSDTNAFVASHAETSDLIMLHRDTGSNTATSKLKHNKKFIAPQTEEKYVVIECPAGMNMKLDGQPLEVIDSSKDPHVNVTRLTEDEIRLRCATGPRGGKR